MLPKRASTCVPTRRFVRCIMTCLAAMALGKVLCAGAFGAGINCCGPMCACRDAGIRRSWLSREACSNLTTWRARNVPRARRRNPRAPGCVLQTSIHAAIVLLRGADADAVQTKESSARETSGRADRQPVAAIIISARRSISGPASQDRRGKVVVCCMCGCACEGGSIRRRVVGSEIRGECDETQRDRRQRRAQESPSHRPRHRLRQGQDRRPRRQGPDRAFRRAHQGLRRRADAAASPPAQARLPQHFVRGQAQRNQYRQGAGGDRCRPSRCRNADRCRTPWSRPA